MTLLRFANPSPLSGWMKDFHLQAVDHARHKKKGRSQLEGAAFFAAVAYLYDLNSGSALS
jgi:hypothetical protein